MGAKVLSVPGADLASDSPILEGDTDRPIDALDCPSGARALPPWCLIACDILSSLWASQSQLNARHATPCCFLRDKRLWMRYREREMLKVSPHATSNAAINKPDSHDMYLVGDGLGLYSGKLRMSRHITRLFPGIHYHVEHRKCRKTAAPSSRMNAESYNVLFFLWHNTHLLGHRKRQVVEVPQILQHRELALENIVCLFFCRAPRQSTNPSMGILTVNTLVSARVPVDRSLHRENIIYFSVLIPSEVPSCEKQDEMSV